MGSIRSVDKSANEWVSDFALQLGIDAPSDEETTSILALAGLAAHSSERAAAPLSCWLAAKAGLSANEGLALAQRLADDDLE